eukprot:179747_1
MLSTLAICLITLFFGSIYGQAQCDPDDYKQCGEKLEKMDYPTVCDTSLECRDCIGCNQACPFIGCQKVSGCSVNDYTAAGKYIVDNKDKLGYLKLCCESGLAIAKCVGCQQANIFDILCGWVYPPLKQALTFGAKSSQLNNDITTNNNNNHDAGFNVNDKTNYFFGIELVGIGAIFGILLVLTMIGILLILNKNKANTNGYKMVNFEANDVEK